MVGAVILMSRYRNVLCHAQWNYVLKQLVYHILLFVYAITCWQVIFRPLEAVDIDITK